MQINRLFEIIYILLEKTKVTAGEMAQRFEVSPRTIYRDIETLSSAGIPVYMSKGRGGGIFILPGFVLNKAVLTQEEKTEVLTSLQAAGLVSFDNNNSALQKLSALFGKANEDWIEVDFTSWANSKDEAALFGEIKTAVLSKMVVSFLYSSSMGETAERLVEPLKLCFKGQAWYLYAYCRKRQDYRFFKLRRIKDFKATQEHFSRSVSARILQNEEGYVQDYSMLTLKLTYDMAFRVFDEFEDFTQQPDGFFLARVCVPSGEWLYQYISSFGEHCEVISPKDIREEVKKRLQKSLNYYL